jgi:hypothetical protein
MSQIHVGIGLPSPSSVDIEFCFGNLPQIMAHAKKQGYKISLLYKSGVRTDSNRNYILNEFLKIPDLTHVLWLDVDQIYPKDIIQKLVEANKPVIGSVYFKRSFPHDPVVYVKNDKTDLPYTAVDLSLSPKKPLEVDGIGFGGMMVKREVYDKLGEDKWTTYGANFHIPTATEHKESHDLIFCQRLQKHGYKIWVHNDVYCHHIAKHAVGLDDYRLATELQRPDDHKTETKTKMSQIAVLMPCIDRPLGTKVIKQLADNAGIEADYFLLMDDERKGFTAKINEFVMNAPKQYDFYVYTAQDAFGGKNWLKEGLSELERTGKGLLAFNDNKWGGRLAAFGMVRASWKKPFFESCYHTHYADTELSVAATLDNQLCYNPKAIMFEVDYDKKTKSVNLEDKKLFQKRQQEIYGVKLFS